MINCTIRDGRAYLSNLGNREAQTLSDLLTFQVPGCEHMPLFKQGKWDGRKSYFDWRTKSFKKGLMEYVRRKSGFVIEVTETDCDSPALEFSYVRPLVDGERKDMRDFQENGAKLLIANNGGMAQMATNAGKTTVIASIVDSALKSGRKVIIMESREDLMDQVKEEIEITIGKKLGRITAKEKNMKDATIIMVPTVAVAMRRIEQCTESDFDVEMINHIKAADIVLTDECHHSISRSYRDVFYLNPRAQRFGFSGTIPGEDDLVGLELIEIFGDVVIRVSNDELVKRGISAKPTINLIEYDVENLEDKVDVFKKSIRNECLKPAFVGYDSNGDKKIELTFSVPTYTAKVKDFVMNYSVNHNIYFWNIIKWLIHKHQNDSVVILVDWVELGEELGKYLGVAVAHSKAGARKEILDSFKNGSINKVIATSILDEGISISKIKVIILATVGSSWRQFLQRIGRGLRKKEDDNTLQVYDFIRYGHRYLIEPSKNRIQIWKAEGFDIQFLEVDDEFIQKSVGGV